MAISTAIMASLSATRGRRPGACRTAPAPRRSADRHRGRLGDADGAGRGLDAGRFEGLHQLGEALALDAAEQVRVRHLEPVEGELVFLHAAIAEHLDLAARQASTGKGSSSVPRGFSPSSSDRPLWPGSSGLVRTSTVIRSARTDG